MRLKRFHQLGRVKEREGVLNQRCPNLVEGLSNGVPEWTCLRRDRQVGSGHALRGL